MSNSTVDTKNILLDSSNHRGLCRSRRCQLSQNRLHYIRNNVCLFITALCIVSLQVGIVVHVNAAVIIRPLTFPLKILNDNDDNPNFISRLFNEWACVRFAFIPCREQPPLRVVVEDPYNATMSYIDTYCPQNQSDSREYVQLSTMVMFYYSTGNSDVNGPLYNRGWATGQSDNSTYGDDGDFCNPCAWRGISCFLNRITSIDCRIKNLDYQLVGTIPQELVQLTGLTGINLEGNAIGGPIPPLQSNWLVNLNLADNDLSGTLPSELGSINTLWTLDLHGNQLVGEIPTTYGQFPHLRKMDLSNNLLSGSVPSELGNLDDLHTLELQWNNLVGIVPLKLCDYFLTIKSDCIEGGIPPQVDCYCCVSCCENEDPDDPMCMDE